MNMTLIGWVLFGLGFVPFRIKRTSHSRGKGKHRQSWSELQIQATFWRLSIEHRPQGRSWRLALPLVARLKSAIWAALHDLIK